MVSKKTVLTKNEQAEQKERFFFHDLINLTHGLLLFLQQKKRAGLHIETQDIDLLEKEIQTLQGLIKGHYRYGHKNLTENSEWIPLSLAQSMLDHMIQVYLKEKDVVVSGDLPSDLFITGPAFYRILNNLVKNIAEAGGQRVRFSFSVKGDSFFILVENEMSETRVSSLQGLGLRSIQYLTKENGGEFSWESAGLFWKSSLSLPLKEKQSWKKSA